MTLSLTPTRNLTLLALVLVGFGLLGMVPYAQMWAAKQAALAHPATVMVAPKLQPSPTIITGKPVRLQVPSLKFDLAVADGVYNQKTGAWTLSNDKAHFAVITTQPNNEGGNTLIYGHYRPEVFAYLHLIKPGAEATIITDNSYAFRYTFRSTEAVDPRNADIFAYKGKPQLTIQTCSGAWMQNRQMYYFDYQGYEKI